MGFPARKSDQIYTYRDYRGWPADERWELIDGVAWNMSPAPSTRHQRMLVWLAARLELFLEQTGCRCYPAPFDVFFPSTPDQSEDEVTTVVQPDISVVCDRNRITPRGCFGPPDIIVELLSPYTSKKDLNEKFLLYEGAGVAEYWVVDPAGEYIQIYQNGSDSGFGDPELVLGEGRAVSSVLSGFAIDARAFFDADRW